MGIVRNFFGCDILRDGKIVHDDLWVRDGRIIDPVSVNFEADESFDCTGSVISPGFIDLKINGAVGVDFADADQIDAGLAKAAAFLPSTGVTYFCPTIISSQPAVYKKILPKFTKTEPTPQRGAGILGVHLDGPFVTVQGGHPKDALIKDLSGGTETVDSVYGTDLENVAIVTLAPEIPGALNVIPTLARWGIKVSVGHSRAAIDVAEESVRVGASMISHLFNAMPNFHHRDPGLVGLVASDCLETSMKFTLICDSYHVHPAALRMAFRIAPEGLMVITDGQPPLGLGPGTFALRSGSVEVAEDNGKSVCRVAGTDTLFGSVCPMHRALRNLMEITDCSLAYALESATKRPAEALGLYPKKGSLEIGADADFAIINPLNFDLMACFIAGQKVADNDFITDLAKMPIALAKPEAPQTPAPGSKRRRNSQQSN